MGLFSEYINRNMNIDEITAERKRQLRKISEIRGGRDILVYASDLTKNGSSSIDYTDILPFQDQLSNLTGDSIDIIIETPGGFAEIVEDLVSFVRSRYEKVGIIIPGYSKSAGTIFAMAGDEILMGSTSALGPIDAQIGSNGKKYSADAFLEGLKQIKEEVETTQKLNPAYIPILQNISPGEIQHCQNAQNFSQKLVYEWLAKYKFKYWDTHSTSGKPVTEADKLKRAKDIAKKLCLHSFWLTHGRSIKIKDFEEMKLRITNYESNPDLNDAIMRYYTLLRMTFESTNMYKIFETSDSQIYRFLVPNVPPTKNIPQNFPEPQAANFDFQCPACNKLFRIQANLGNNHPLEVGSILFPVDNNIFVCPNCGTPSNLAPVRLQIEAQSGKRIVK